MAKLKIIKQIEFLKLKKEEYKINLENPYIYMQEDELIEFNLNRNFDIERLNKIFKDAQDPIIVMKYLGIKEFGRNEKNSRDMYIGLKLHSNFHLSRSEASRYEFWNSVLLQVEEARNYLNTRNSKSLETHELLKKYLVFNDGDMFIENRISSPWWIVEMTRNGEDYSVSKMAFKLTSNFYNRWFTSPAFHNPILTLSFIYFLENKNWLKCLDGKKGKEYKNMQDYINLPSTTELSIRRNISVNLQTVLNDHISTNEYLKKINKIKIDYDEEAYKEWLENSNEVGPKDFKIDKKVFHSLEEEFELVLDLYYKDPYFGNEDNLLEDGDE